MKNYSKMRNQKERPGYKAHSNFPARASRLEGKVKNVGIRPVRKKKQK